MFACLFTLCWCYCRCDITVLCRRLDNNSFLGFMCCVVCGFSVCFYFFLAYFVFCFCACLICRLFCVCPVRERDHNSFTGTSAPSFLFAWYYIHQIESCFACLCVLYSFWSCFRAINLFGVFLLIFVGHIHQLMSIFGSTCLLSVFPRDFLVPM